MTSSITSPPAFLSRQIQLGPISTTTNTPQNDTISNTTPSLSLLITPLSTSSLQIIISHHDTPKPSGDLFRIEYLEKEIMHYLTLKRMEEVSLERKGQQMSQNQQRGDEGNDANESSTSQQLHEANELTQQVPFEITQLLGDRNNENLSLPIYRIASFGLKLMQQTAGRIMFKEIYVMWGGINVARMSQEEIHVMVRNIEKALEGSL